MFLLLHALQLIPAGRVLVLDKRGVALVVELVVGVDAKSDLFVGQVAQIGLAGTNFCDLLVDIEVLHRNDFAHDLD